MRAGRKRRQLAIERRDADRRKAEERRRGGADDSAFEEDAEDPTGRPEEAEKNHTESPIEDSDAIESGVEDEVSHAGLSDELRPELAQDHSLNPPDEISAEKIEKPDELEVAAADLETLGRELEKSITGGAHATSVSAPSAPPGLNATPEDILGVPTQRAALEDDKPDESAPVVRPSEDVPATGGQAAPMDAYKEHAAMAKEVLRATSDQARNARRQPKDGGEGSDSGSDSGSEEVEESEQNVRFSEDLTISSRKSRRKLFRR